MREDEDADFDDFGDEAIAEIERRHDLQRDVRLGAEIEVDLAQRGPLHRYMQARREKAVTALMDLISTDPNDGVAVARQQALVTEYLVVRDWVRLGIEAAVTADQTLQGDDREQEEQD